MWRHITAQLVLTQEEIPEEDGSKKPFGKEIISQKLIINVTALFPPHRVPLSLQIYERLSKSSISIYFFIITFYFQTIENFVKTYCVFCILSYCNPSTKPADLEGLFLTMLGRYFRKILRQKNLYFLLSLFGQRKGRVKKNKNFFSCLYVI